MKAFSRILLSEKKYDFILIVFVPKQKSNFTEQFFTIELVLLHFA